MSSKMHKHLCLGNGLTSSFLTIAQHLQFFMQGLVCTSLCSMEQGVPNSDQHAISHAAAAAAALGSAPTARVDWQRLPDCFTNHLTDQHGAPQEVLAAGILRLQTLLDDRSYLQQLAKALLLQPGEILKWVEHLSQSGVATIPEEVSYEIYAAWAQGAAVAELPEVLELSAAYLGAMHEKVQAAVAATSRGDAVLLEQQQQQPPVHQQAQCMVLQGHKQLGLNQALWSLFGGTSLLADSPLLKLLQFAAAPSDLPNKNDSSGIRQRACLASEESKAAAAAGDGGAGSSDGAGGSFGNQVHEMTPLMKKLLALLASGHPAWKPLGSCMAEEQRDYLDLIGYKLAERSLLSEPLHKGIWLKQVKEVGQAAVPGAGGTTGHQPPVGAAGKGMQRVRVLTAAGSAAAAAADPPPVAAAAAGGSSSCISQRGQGYQVRLGQLDRPGDSGRWWVKWYCDGGGITRELLPPCEVGDSCTDNLQLQRCILPGLGLLSPGICALVHNSCNCSTRTKILGFVAEGGMLIAEYQQQAHSS
jgi:hypothetical protein